MGRRCSTRRQARQARFIHMCNVSVRQWEKSSTISNKLPASVTESICSRRWKASIGSRDATISPSSSLCSTTADGTHQRCLHFWSTRTGYRRSRTDEVSQIDLNILCTVADLAQISISRSTLLPITPESQPQLVRRGVRQSLHRANLILLSRRRQMLFRVGDVL